jgi:hypothetical protein
VLGGLSATMWQVVLKPARAWVKKGQVEVVDLDDDQGSSLAQPACRCPRTGFGARLPSAIMLKRCSFAIPKQGGEAGIIVVQ